MSFFEQIQEVLGTYARPILDSAIPLSYYTPIDLSMENDEIIEIQLSDPEVCQAYINRVLERTGSEVAFGGYLEKRLLYSGNPSFEGPEEHFRNIHLGMDFWAAAGTKVVAPLAGKVHSFKNNESTGDYGPTIILRHEVENFVFHTLYGHLSISSLDGLYEGKPIHEGAAFATLGSTEVNVNYAPHLHFQIILNIGDYLGDYPGVSSEADLEWYKANCPNPNIILNY